MGKNLRMPQPEIEITHLLPVTAIYAIFCLFWAGFSHWLGPSIIDAAHAGKIPSILSWSFHSTSSLPVEHYIQVWSAISCAVYLAAILHLVIVFFIRSIDKKHPFLPLNTATEGSRTNLVLFVFSAVFLALCIVVGPRGDHVLYIKEWRDVLEGRNPWQLYGVGAGLSYRLVLINVYGPLFNVLAPFILITYLANKLLFAFIYLVYVIWLIKDFGRDRGLVPLSWPAIVFWIVNPIAWI